MVTTAGRKIVDDAAAGTAGCARGTGSGRSRTRRACTTGASPIIPIDRDHDGVEQQPRVLDAGPTRRRSSRSAARMSTSGRGAPRALPGDRRRAGSAGSTNVLDVRPGLKQRQRARLAVDRHLVDVERPPVVVKGLRIGRPQRRARLGDLVARLDRQRRRLKQRRQERRDEARDDQRQQEANGRVPRMPRTAAASA